MINIGINRIDVNRHEIIKERGMHLAEVLSGKEKEYILSIVDKSKKFLNEIGNENNVVLDPSSKDLQIFKTAVKRYVRTDFINPSLSRIKDVSLRLEDIDGICDECMKHKKEFNEGRYDLCNDCEKKSQFRLNIYFVQHGREKMIEHDFQRAIEETNFSDELMGNWMLLIKKKRQGKEYKQIDNVLKEFIRNELMNEFINQNKQLTKKYELWQNQ